MKRFWVEFLVVFAWCVCAGETSECLSSAGCTAASGVVGLRSVCLSWKVNGEARTRCDSYDSAGSTNDLDNYYIGEVDNMSLLNSSFLVTTPFTASSRLSFQFRVYDSFEKPKLKTSQERSWIAVPHVKCLRNDCFTLIENNVITAETSTNSYSMATEGAVRVVEIEWRLGKLVHGVKVFFTQVNPPRNMSDRETQLLKQAQIVIVGGGFAGLTIAKALRKSLFSPEQMVVLEKAEILRGFDDIITSRALADLTIRYVAQGCCPKNSSAPKERWMSDVLEVLETTRDDITYKRNLVRKELGREGINFIENVNPQWMQDMLGLFHQNSTIIDARGGEIVSTYRHSIVRLLLNLQLSNMEVNMYGFAYAAHTMLPSLIASGLTVNIVSRNQTLNPVVYDEQYAFRTLNMTLSNWVSQNKALLVSTGKNIEESVYNKITNLYFLGRRRKSPEVTEKVPYKFSLVIPTAAVADQAILLALNKVSECYNNVSCGNLRTALRSPPAMVIKLLQVSDYAYSKSTAADDGYTQFYGMPTVGWAGIVDDSMVSSTVSVQLKHFYPLVELQRITKFLLGRSSSMSNWKFTAYLKDQKMVGLSGTYFAPLIIDLWRPLLNADANEINRFLTEFASNRGNWPTDLLRSLLQKSLVVLTSNKTFSLPK